MRACAARTGTGETMTTPLDQETPIETLPVLAAGPDPEILFYQVLDLYLAGRRGAITMAKVLEQPTWVPQIQKILNSAKFLTLIHDAKRDIVASVTTRLRRNVHKYITVMDALAGDESDKRTQFQAAKDLLDRAGTGAAQKLSISTPSAYRAAVEDLLEDDAKELDGDHALEGDFETEVV